MPEKQNVFGIKNEEIKTVIKLKSTGLSALTTDAANHNQMLFLSSSPALVGGRGTA